MTKSIRLNSIIREQILENIRAAYLTNTPEPVLDNIPDFDYMFDDAVIKAHTAKVQPIIDAAKKDPALKNYIIYDSNIWYFNKTGYRERVPLSGNKLLPSTRQEALFNIKAFNDGEKDHKVPTNIQKILKDQRNYYKDTLKPHQDLVKEHNKVLRLYMEEVSQVLQGVNTSKQLLEVWPEVEKFLPKGTVNPSSITLPAVSIANLNAALAV